MHRPERSPADDDRQIVRALPEPALVNATQNCVDRHRQWTRADRQPTGARFGTAHVKSQPPRPAVVHRTTRPSDGRAVPSGAPERHVVRAGDAARQPALGDTALRNGGRCVWRSPPVRSLGRARRRARFGWLIADIGGAIAASTSPTAHRPTSANAGAVRSPCAQRFAEVVDDVSR